MSNERNRKTFVETTQKYKNSLIALVAAISAFIVLVNIISPTIDSLLEVKGSIPVQEEKLSKLLEKEAILKKANQNDLAIRATFADNAVPSTINLPLILATVQSVATESGVVLGQFSIVPNAQVLSFLPIDAGEKITVFTFKVNLVGSFENMERFIDGFKRVTPLMSLESLEFSQEKSSATINFYFQPKNVIKTSAEAPVQPMTDKQTKMLEELAKLPPPVLDDTSLGSGGTNVDRQSPFR